jgi:glycosyltransferase involved in cell wall biosynthesis
VYVNQPHEDWICDRFAKEFREDNSDIVTTNPKNADVIWALADWAWGQIPVTLSEFYSKKFIVTVHHVVPDKYDPSYRREFYYRDQFVNCYHVPNEHTKQFVERITKKQVVMIPYWANGKIWRTTGTRECLRKKYSLPLDGYIVGSFQRDTEGSSIPSGQFQPKLEKGPDLFVDYVKKLCAVKNNVHVLLSGWRRQWVIKELEGIDVNYTYVELPSQEIVNELYQTLDIYPVTSRYEGGPQSLIECGLLKISCISRHVGLAEQVLPSDAIKDDVFNATPTIPCVDHLVVPVGYQSYRKLFEEV